MKRIFKLMGLLMVILIITASCNFAHRRENNFRMWAFRKEMMMNRPGMMGGRMFSRGNFNWYGPGSGMNGRMGMGAMRRGIGEMGPGMMLERIPGLTDQQRKELQDLWLKQVQDRDKLREETISKAMSLRNDFRSKVMNVLTDEQKKFIEQGAVPGNQAPPR